jgi:hypothetical protein
MYSDCEAAQLQQHNTPLHIATESNCFSNRVKAAEEGLTLLLIPKQPAVTGSREGSHTF